MTLLDDLKFVDPAQDLWIAPKGSIVDGASIPQPFWSIIGGPFEGLYRDASVIHDVACDERKKHWWAVHEVFYFGMRARGVNAIQAKVMYAAVYHFGPRWPFKLLIPGPPKSPMERPVYQVPPPHALDMNGFEELRKLIEAREIQGQAMTLAEISFFGAASKSGSQLVAEPDFLRKLSGRE